MKKMKTKNKCLVTSLAIIAMLMMSLGVKAQDVSIDPTSGSLVTSVPRGVDTGYILGLSALWRHEQLALSMTGSDRDGWESNVIEEPSTVFGERDGMLTVVGGRRPSFIVVSLPMGYRITGYDIVLVNNLVGADMAPGKSLGDKNHFHHLNTRVSQTWGTNDEYVNNSGLGTMRFYETTQWSEDQTNGPQDQDLYNLNLVRRIIPGSLDDGGIGSTILATAKADDDDIDINNNAADTNKEYKISRHSNDIGNQLYFRLVKDYTFYGLSIKSFVIYFTAEGTFDAPIGPAVADVAHRVVSSPFKTNKIDIGVMEKRYQDGHNNDENYAFFAYNYENQHEIDAYNTIYQERAVKDGVPYELASDAQGTITPHIYPVKVDNQNLFAFEEDVYYVEPPVSVHTSSGLDAPIGYRIVGAKFEYLWGSDVSASQKTVNGYAITYTSGGTTYYLNDELHFTTNEYIWLRDNNNNFYTDDGFNKRYLACNGSGNTRTLSYSMKGEGDAARWNLHRERNGRIYYQSDNNTYYLHGTTETSATPTLTTSTQNRATSATASRTYTIPGFSAGTYKLNIYDKTGESIEKTIEVTQAKATSSNNYYLLEGLNNDAVKFSITDLQTGKKALVRVTLQLQALDPYINNMQVNCVNLPKELQMSQKFTATNFKVSGGSFIFYVPSELLGEKMDISFSELYSDYGDNTYWGEEESLTNSRYSFVTSSYFYPINGNGNLGLYDGAYTPNSDYTTKVITATAGNVRYKFNNAENLGNSGTGSAFLEEYPFSVKTYLSNYKDPDAAAGSTPTVAKFEECHVVAGNDEHPQPAGKFFVFIADETRYNIAPTTNWQHRDYAFYRMDVKAIAKTYEPVLTWDKVYESALYTTKDEDNNEVKGEKAQFGLRLTTTDAGNVANGYLTVKQIQETINAAITAEKATPTGNVPESKDQILYVDASSLLAVYNYVKKEGTTTPEPSTLEGLKEGMGANSLIYLPKSTTTTLDNFAYLTKDNTFRAGNHIVLTDKQPFYSKYDIQIAPANWATYTRSISAAENGQVENATIMLPFTLTVKNGLHTNPEETPACSFYVNTMKSGATMSLATGSSIDHGTAFFDKITGTVAEANTPYMIHVESSNASANDNFSFIVAEKGAKIIATNILGENNPNGTGWLHTGEEDVSASFDKYNYKFTNKATFSGAKFDRAESEDVFYFAHNMYLDLRTLSLKDSEGKPNQYLYIYPFRGVYTYERTAKASGAKPMHSFDISFDEMPIAGIATWLDEVEGTKPDLMIRSDRGKLTITASRSQDVVIRSVNGMVVKNTNVEAGNTTTVALPAGIYVVNNTKITVK